jgi:argininosuccinate lyase
MALWDKGDSVDEAILAFSAGDEYRLDERLVPYDCRASIAHVRMLETVGGVTSHERDQLIAGLEEITRLHASGAFVIRRDQEDCHTAIEEWLTTHVGEAGKKIHLGRSRNDQVLTALRLYEKEALVAVRERLAAYRQAVVDKAAAHGDVPMPGYTHMRRAMPTTVGTWLSAFADAALDDRVLLDTVLTLIDRSPLGTGAGYGIPVFDLDRSATAEELGFAMIHDNPISAHMSRGKYEGLILAALSQTLFGLNRLATDLLIFSMPELGFVRLPASLCTGSSVMPQKQNPDVLELVRAKYHVVLAEEFKVKSLIGNLMTGYQRDLGLTKEPVYIGCDTTRACLDIMTLVVDAVEIDAAALRAAMSDDLHATAAAYRLVKNGMPFRDAYRRIAEQYRKSSNGAPRRAPCEGES